MLEKDFGIWSFVGIFPEDKVYEAFDLRRSHFQDGVFSDDFVQIIAVFYHERVVLRDHFVSEGTKSPNVAFHVVSFSFEDFRRKVKRSSANSPSELTWLVN